VGKFKFGDGLNIFLWIRGTHGSCNFTFWISPDSLSRTYISLMYLWRCCMLHMESPC